MKKICRLRSTCASSMCKKQKCARVRYEESHPMVQQQQRTISAGAACSGRFDMFFLHHVCFNDLRVDLQYEKKFLKLFFTKIVQFKITIYIHTYTYKRYILFYFLTHRKVKDEVGYLVLVSATCRKTQLIPAKGGQNRFKEESLFPNPVMIVVRVRLCCTVIVCEPRACH